MTDVVQGIELTEYDRHNEQIEAFYETYEAYLGKCIYILNARNRVAEIQLTLKNTGFSPAQGIDLYVHFPDGLQVSEEIAEDLCRFPPEPEAPKGPMSTTQKILEKLSKASMFNPSMILRNSIFSLDAISNPKDFPSPERLSIKKTNSFEVHFPVTHVKHHLDRMLDPLFVTFDSWETARSCTIDYRILASNIPRPVLGKLHLIVEVGTESSHPSQD